MKIENYLCITLVAITVCMLVTSLVLLKHTVQINGLKDRVTQLEQRQ